MVGLASAAAVVVVAPAIAHACPGCFAGTQNREAYFVTFVLLTVLPLAVMGLTIGWLVRRARTAEKSAEKA